MSKQCILIGVAVLMVTLVGCGGKHSARVSGEVLLDGQPLPEGCIGTVAFFPTAGGPPATGKIEEDSSYILRTGRDASLPPGEYSVTVGVNAAPSSLRSPSGGPPPPGKPITPPHYRQSKTSGLNYTVEGGKNTIDLELTTGSS